MRFYIYENENWTQVYLEIEPKLSLAWDTTNDSFSCVLQASTKDIPYKPMTAFKIIDDNNQEIIMWIINDSVTTFSLSPITYKHTLNIVQYRYFLNKHLVRNTVFNQPRINKQKLYTAVSVNLDNPSDNYACFPDTNNTIQRWYDDININYHGKVKSLFLKWDFYGVYLDIENGQQPLKKIPKDLVRTANGSLRMGTRISIVDINNSNYVLIRYYIFEFEQGKRIQLPQSLVETINTYLATHQSATLRALYGVDPRPGDSEPTDPALLDNNNIKLSFLNTIDDQETYATVNSFEPLTLQVEIEVEYYYYTMYDVIDTLLKQYRLYSENFGYKREQLFNLPVSGDLYDLLTTTYPPDSLSFTQATFYDALTEIFRFYDAGFKFDENKTLQIEYYNNPQDEKENIKVGGVSVHHSEQNYNNGRVAYYQNSINKVDIKRLGTRSTGLGVPEKTQYAIILPKPIYDIEKLSMFLSGTFTLCNQPDVKINNFELDLTHFTVNENIWCALDKISVSFSGTTYNYLYQEGTIKFSRGSNEINVSSYYRDVWNREKNILQNVIRMAWRRFFGINHGFTTGNWGEPSFSDFSAISNDWVSQVFSIKYQTLNHGRLQTETLNNKYTGELIVNQGSGLIDLNKLGLNMLGESLKDGEPVLTATHEITDWNDRIKEGNYITYNGSMWLANVVNYNVLGNGVYQGTIEFSKNFNALSLRTHNDNEKRLTAISAEQTTISEENYIDYIYVFVNNLAPERDNTVLSISSLESMLTQTFGIATSYNIEYAKITTFDANKIVNTNGDGNIAADIFIPLIKYGAGNCICFEIQFDSPVNAGNQLVKSSGWFGSNQYFSQATLYTDDEGWADKITIRFCKDANYSIATYPKIPSSITEGMINFLDYYKKPNEIFALNYEWCFLPLPSQINDVFIGNQFINNNSFVSNEFTEQQFYLYYGNTKYTILDKKGHGTKVSARLGISSSSSLNFLKMFILTTSTITAKSWALCDASGNIYFACNIEKTFTSSSATTSGIYFLTRRTRVLDDEELSELPNIAPTNLCDFEVSPDEWTVFPAEWTTDAAIEPPYGSIIDGNNIIYFKNYSYQNLTLIGVSMSSVVIENTSAHRNNTVSYDSTTGTFSGTIYSDSPTEPQTAKITYKRVGQTGMSLHHFSQTVPELVGASLRNISISPSSDVSEKPNTVSFDSATGTFSGIVYKATQPNTEVLYTITYTIN